MGEYREDIQAWAYRLRKELKGEYPNTKFRVSSQEFELCTGLIVSWVGGPPMGDMEGFFDGVFSTGDKRWDIRGGRAKEFENIGTQRVMTLVHWRLEGKSPRIEEGRVLKSQHRFGWVWAEMARRKLRFHADEDWDKIQLWGLFEYRDISQLIEGGELKTYTNPMNRTVWVKPSESAYRAYIEPLLSRSIDELENLAGW
jgi:hypothetical protein